jgi:hypothetical protein
MKRKNVLKPTLAIVSTETGVSPRVISYLGHTSTASLPEELSWSEFIAIWHMNKKKFEKTHFFKKRMKPYRTLQKDKDMIAIRTIINEHAHARRLFLQVLPVSYAVTLCTTLDEYKMQYDRTHAASDRRTIRMLVTAHVATMTLSYPEIVVYRSIVGHTKRCVQELLHTFMQTRPHDAVIAALVCRYSTSEIKALCTLIDKDTHEDMCSMDELLQLFKKYPSRSVVASIIKRYTDTRNKHAWTKCLIGLMEAHLLYKDTVQQEESNWQFFPVLRVVLPSIEFTVPHAKTILQFLPYVDSYNEIDRILERVVAAYDAKPGEMSIKDFVLWYTYNPARADMWIRLYKKALLYNCHEQMQGVIEAYQLCKDEEILETAIAQQLSKIEYPTKSFMTFFIWLCKEHHAIYTMLHSRIEKVGYLHKWGNALMEKGTDKDKKRYLKLVTYFS